MYWEGQGGRMIIKTIDDGKSLRKRKWAIRYIRDEVFFLSHGYAEQTLKQCKFLLMHATCIVDLLGSNIFTTILVSKNT